MPLFLPVCYLIHPWLGMVALGGGLILFGFTYRRAYGRVVPKTKPKA